MQLETRFSSPIACCQYGPYLFSFKKKDGKVLAELFDATLKLQKELPVDFASKEHSPKMYLRSLRENGLIPIAENERVIFCHSSQPAFVLTLAGEMIKILKAEILKGVKKGEKECQDEDDLICPLSQELWIDPVVDSCGHVFERSYIEKWLLINSICPINRKPINKNCLNPVRPLKEQAEKIRNPEKGEEIRNKFPIPTPGAVDGSQIDKQPKKAALYLEAAKGLIEVNDYAAALNQYKNALMYTNDSTDYAPLAAYLERQDKTFEAAYSLYCLAILQYQEKKEEYKQTFNKAYALASGSGIVPVICKAQHLQLDQKTQQASAIFCELAQSALNEQNREKAIEFFERALECTPDQICLYYQLEDLYEGNRKIPLYLLGITYFGCTNPYLAQEFYKKATTLAPDEPFIYLTYLTTLKKTDQQLIGLYRRLAFLHQKKGNTEEYLYFLSKLIGWRASQDYQIYAQALVTAGKVEEAKIVYKNWTVQLLNDNKRKEAFKAIQETIAKTGGTLELLRLQHTMSQEFTPKQERKAAFDLAEAYKKEDPERAKGVYIAIQDKFHDYKSAEFLGDFFAQTDREKSVKFYYAASKNALRQHKFQRIARIVRKAQGIDLGLGTLTDKQREIFLGLDLLNAEMQVAKTRLQVLEEKKNLRKPYEEKLASGLEAITQPSNNQIFGKPVISIVAPYFPNERFLKPSLIEEIMDGGNIKSMYKNSTRPVYQLQYKKEYDLHLKQNPSQPLMDYAVHSLTSHIAGRKLSPTTQLVRFNVCIKGEKRSYPVLISETINGKSLKNSYQELSADDPSLTWNLLCSILTRPGDGRFSNYILDNQKNLYCINNTASFVEPSVNSFFRAIHFCSAPFCLFPLDSGLNTDVLKQFLSLDCQTILTDWMKDVIQKEKEYTMLFSEEERKILYQENNSFTPSILLRGGTLATIRLQFLNLKKALKLYFKKNNSFPTAGDLLKEMISLKENSMGNHVYEAYNHRLLSPENRLKKATQRELEQSMTSTQYYHACLEKVPSLEEIEHGKLYSPEKALDEILAMKIENNQQRVDFGKFKNDHRRQTLVLQALSWKLKNTTHKPTSFIFHHIQVLTLPLLKPFLHQDLETLELQDCDMIKESVFESIRKECPKIKNLTFCRCPGIKEVRVEFSKVENFTINNCDNLRSVELESSVLKNFIGRYNPLLKETVFTAKWPKYDFTGSPQVEAFYKTSKNASKNHVKH